VLSIASVAPIVFSQWLQQGLGRYLPGASLETALDLKVAAVGALVVIGSIAIWISTISILVLLHYLGSEWTGALLPGAILVVATVAFSPLVAILQAELRAGRYAAYQIANVVLKFALSVAALFVFASSWTGLVWAYAIGTLGLIPFLWRDCHLPGMKLVAAKWHDAVGHIRTIGKYGFPMIGWFMAAFFLSVGDRFVIQYFRGEADVGIYSANYQLVTRGVGLITTPILLAAHPILMKARARDDKAGASRFLGCAIEWFALSGIVLVSVFSVFAFDVARLFLGSGFRTGYLAMPIVLAGEIAWQVGQYTHKPLEFMGRTKTMLILGMTMAAVNVILNVIFVPFFGFMAAAFATLACYLGYAVVTARTGRRYVPWSMNWRRVALVGVTEVLMVGTLSFVRHFVEASLGYFAGFFLVTSLVVATQGILLVWIVRPLLRTFVREQHQT
jgi:O-antigen/teichoic acid export membrane protein